MLVWVGRRLRVLEAWINSSLQSGVYLSLLLLLDGYFEPRWAERGHVGPMGLRAQLDKLFDCVVNIGLG